MTNQETFKHITFLSQTELVIFAIKNALGALEYTVLIQDEGLDEGWHILFEDFVDDCSYWDTDTGKEPRGLSGLIADLEGLSEKGYNILNWDDEASLDNNEMIFSLKKLFECFHDGLGIHYHKDDTWSTDPNQSYYEMKDNEWGGP